MARNSSPLKNQEIPTDDKNPFISISWLLNHTPAGLTSREVSDDEKCLTSGINWLPNHQTNEATLATAIEEHGVYTWDRFGRFCKADEEATGIALDLLAAQYEWSCDPNPNKADPRSPVDCSEGPDNPYKNYGWANKVLPDLEAIKENLPTPVPTQRRSGDTKKFQTLHIIIAAMASKAGIEIKERGAAGQIKESLGFISTDDPDSHIKISEETIRNVINDVNETIERRQQKG